MKDRFNDLCDTLFPDISIHAREIAGWLQAILFIVFTVLFTLLGRLLPLGGYIGFDWYTFYSQGRAPVFYPPWTHIIISLLSWELLIGVTLAGFSLAVIRRSKHPVSVISALLCLPLLWTIFLGQLEGIVVAGLLVMPWLAPLALIKPQVSIFAFLAKRSYLVVVILFLILTIIIWGMWPLRTLNVESFYNDGRYPQNIGLGWWALPISLVLLWFSRGDMDMLMISGCFMLPHLIPYNLLPIAPAIARLKPKASILAFIFSWLPFSANWFGPKGWWLGWIFILWLWFNIAAQRYPKSKASQWLLRYF